MIGRRATAGLSLLCALAFCAVAVQSASAEVGTKAVNTTAVTCVEGKGESDFKDPHCDEKVEPGTGKFGHVGVTAGETKSINAVNTSTISLKGMIGGVLTELTCLKMATTTEKSFVHNIETEKKHTLTGNGTALFTECEVKKPAGCRVKEPITAAADFEGVEGLGAGKNEMGVEFKGAGGGAIAELVFENKGAEKCGIANGGKAYVAKGSAIGTSQESQTNKHTGATIVFAPGGGMETIEIAGKAMEVNMTVTPSGVGGGGHPIPITTVT